MHSLENVTTTAIPPWLYQGGGRTNFSNLLERIVACGLLILASPIMLMVAITLYFAQGSPVIYSGRRIGQFGQDFLIRKFRTLENGAEQRVRGQVLQARSNDVTPLGRYLRATRIDELPQLWNVAMGEMSLFGPRPIRHAFFHEHRDILPCIVERPPYKPGLIGPVQLYMPHGASQRIRYRFFRHLYLRPNVEPPNSFRLAALCGGAMARLGVSLLMHHSAPGAWLTHDRRQSYRCKTEGRVTLTRHGADGEKTVIGNVLDIDDHACTLTSVDVALSAGDVVVFEVRRKRRGLWQIRSARCRVVRVNPLNRPGTKHEVLVFFEPASDVGQYVLERYILGKTLL
ncbi:sugar transferase [Rhodospira trueperi]|uniref:Sugar transferase n=1 Tax=Rhodospira trueperi TaxID=69960 RepID=A0A1G7BYE3_9PROT|nr:sugar transferase [Rhodospira trueperi]SDE32118.1 sugar transferase [Rhodospira trueperi]